ncbi:unnamed protein product [Prunus armeniaca]
MLGIPNLAACLATMTVLQLRSLECLLMKSIWVGIKRGTLLATGLRAYAADPDLQREWMMVKKVNKMRPAEYIEALT